MAIVAGSTRHRFGADSSSRSSGSRDGFGGADEVLRWIAAAVMARLVGSMATASMRRRRLFISCE